MKRMWGRKERKEKDKGCKNGMTDKAQGRKDGKEEEKMRGCVRKRVLGGKRGEGGEGRRVQ